MSHVDQILLDSPTLKAFLNRAFSESALDADESAERLTYAGFARKAGFSSRSFPRDVAVGKRKLTHVSLLKFIRGFELKGDSARLLKALAAIDNPELAPRASNEDERRQEVERIRAKLTLRRERLRESHESAIYHHRAWPYLFAAIGTPTEGSSLEELTRKTGYSEKECLGALEEMLRHGIIRREAGRYLPSNAHVLFSEELLPGAFQSFYLDTVKKVERRASTAFNDSRQLFFNSVFSVPSNRLPELKTRLKSLLLEFIDRSESPTGEDIATLVCALLAPEARA